MKKISKITNNGELTRLYDMGALREAEIELYFTVQLMERESFTELLNWLDFVEECRGAYNDLPNIPVLHGFTIKARYGKVLKWNEEGLIVSYISDYDGVEHRLVTFYNRYKDDPVSNMLYIIDGLIGVAEHEESLDPYGSNKVIKKEIKHILAA